MYKCTYPNCNKKMNDLKAYSDHVYLNHSIIYGFKYKCPICKREYDRFPDLKSHIEKKHGNQTIPLNENFKYICYFESCKKMFDKVTQLKDHLFTHLCKQARSRSLLCQNHNKCLQLKCLFKNCYFETNVSTSYSQHLSKQHRFEFGEREIKSDFIKFVDNNDYFIIPEYNQEPNMSPEQIPASESIEIYDQVENSPLETFPKYSDEEIREFYMMTYLKYHAFHGIPKYICDNLFEDILLFLRINNTNLYPIIEKCHAQCKNTPPEEIINLLNNENPIKKVHEKSKTDLKKEIWKKESNLYVKPKEILLTNKQKFHYVPIIENIKSLLSNERLLEDFLKKNNHENGLLIKRFNDSLNFKNNRLFSEYTNTIKIKLFIDEFNLLNPLGDNRKKKKMTGVYYKIDNFSQKHQSIDYLTQLALIFDSNFLKNFDYSKVFEKFVDDIKLLENEGICIPYKDQNLLLKGTISYIVGDNLGSNKIGGFVESFRPNVKGYCRFCYASFEDTQNCFRDECFVPRTLEKHLDDVIKQKNGVKKSNCFEELEHFNVINGLPPDSMHNFLEGVLVYDFGLLMNYLNRTGTLTVNDLNQSLENFEYSRIDKKNKVPSIIFTNNSLKTNYGFKLSATHSWNLMRIFPLIFGDILYENEYFQNFILLVGIFRDLNGNEYSEELIQDIEHRIENYLKTLTQLEKITLTPKHHFMVHVGRSIREFGPPKQYSTLRFESKHSNFKNIHLKTHNNKNTTKSLAQRHQDKQLFHLKSPFYFDEYTLGPEISENEILNMIKLLRGENILAYKYVQVFGTDYYENDFLIIKKDYNNLPLFGRIDLIYKKNDIIYFALTKVKTIGYIEYLLSYQIEMDERESILEHISQSSLKNFYPLNSYNINGQIVLPVKYPIE
ncbi:unnamed protein product [Brachionus calyciflorus]|uniref:C2H2-type domain-containing protein n=1 Tax=Brachionus calyciflorus TaxID=104777 RepID=A0A814KEL8_9BILA|nr:unnamed protein product [Brachionus calyciflorus]